MHHFSLHTDIDILIRILQALSPVYIRHNTGVHQLGSGVACVVGFKEKPGTDLKQSVRRVQLGTLGIQVMLNLCRGSSIEVRESQKTLFGVMFWQWSILKSISVF